MRNLPCRLIQGVCKTMSNYLAMSDNLPFRLFQFPVSIISLDSAPRKSRQSCVRKDEKEWPNFKFNLERRPSLFFIAVSEENILAATLYLQQTVVLCPDKVKPGAFHRNNIFVFWMPDNACDLTDGIQDTFSQRIIQKHERVIAIRSTGRKKSNINHFLFWRYNLYTNKLSFKDFLMDSSKNILNTFYPPFDMKVISSIM